MISDDDNDDDDDHHHHSLSLQNDLPPKDLEPYFQPEIRQRVVKQLRRINFSLH